MLHTKKIIVWFLSCIWLLDIKKYKHISMRLHTHKEKFIYDWNLCKHILGQMRDRFRRLVPPKNHFAFAMRSSQHSSDGYQ